MLFSTKNSILLGIAMHALTPALKRQRQGQADFCEFKAYLIYMVSSRQAPA